MSKRATADYDRSAPTDGVRRRAWLSAADVRIIHTRYHAGATAKALARDFNRSLATINRLLNDPVVPIIIRGGSEHWTMLGRLLGRFQQCVQAASRLDAYRGPTARGDRYFRGFDERCRKLEQRIDRELQRVTSERLLMELDVRKTEGGPHPGRLR